MRFYNILYKILLVIELLYPYRNICHHPKLQRTIECNIIYLYNKTDKKNITNYYLLR